MQSNVRMIWKRPSKENGKKGMLSTTPVWSDEVSRHWTAWEGLLNVFLWNFPVILSLKKRLDAEPTDQQHACR